MTHTEKPELWIGVRIEYIYHFFNTRDGRNGPHVVPSRALTSEALKRMLKNSPWLTPNADTNKPDIRLEIKLQRGTIRTSDSKLVEEYLKEGEKELLRKHNEVEFRGLGKKQAELARQKGEDAREAVKEALTIKSHELSSVEQEFARWFVNNGFEVPATLKSETEVSKRWRRTRIEKEEMDVKLVEDAQEIWDGGNHTKKEVFDNLSKKSKKKYGRFYTPDALRGQFERAGGKLKEV